MHCVHYFAMNNNNQTSFTVTFKIAITATFRFNNMNANANAHQQQQPPTSPVIVRPSNHYVIDQPTITIICSNENALEEEKEEDYLSDFQNFHLDDK